MSELSGIGHCLDIAATVSGFVSSALLMAGAIKALGWKKIEEASDPGQTLSPTGKTPSEQIRVIVHNAASGKLKEIGRIERKLVYPGFALLVLSFLLSYVQKVIFPS